MRRTVGTEEAEKPGSSWDQPGKKKQSPDLLWGGKFERGFEQKTAEGRLDSAW